MTTEVRPYEAGDIIARYVTDDTHVALCPAGDHLRVARRWQRTCTRCGQSIPSGNVGPVTWDDSHQIGNPARCGWGTHDFQHGCGQWNTPTEVTVDPADYTSLEEALADAIRRLDAACEAEQTKALRETEARLRRDLRRALDKLAAGWSEEDVIDGGEFDPGVWRNYDGRLEAWDFDPTVIDGWIDVNEEGLRQAE